MEVFDYEREDEFEQPGNDWLMDMIIRAIRNDTPKARVLIPERVRDIRAAKEAMDRLLFINNQSEEAQVKFYPQFSAAAISANFDVLEVRDYELFYKIICNASNFEITPLVNDSVSFSVAFSHVMVSM